MANRNLFHKAHYNILAKQIRNKLDPLMDRHTDRIGSNERQKIRLRRATLVDFAIDLAKRLKEDNESFDPLAWLDACSPNPELYPLSELWEEA